MSTSMFLIDLYGPYSASALAGSRIIQCVTAAFLPLAAQPLYLSLGYGMGNSVLGIIALVMLPIPVLFYIYGDTLAESVNTVAL